MQHEEEEEEVKAASLTVSSSVSSPCRSRSFSAIWFDKETMSRADRISAPRSSNAWEMVASTCSCFAAMERSIPTMPTWRRVPDAAC